jgi:hypothetical protein
MTILSNSPRDDAYTFAELASVCRNAGFDGRQFVPLQPMPQSPVVTEKP